MQHLQSCKGEKRGKDLVSVDRHLMIDPYLLVRKIFKLILHVLMGAACPDVVEHVCRRMLALT